MLNQDFFARAQNHFDDALPFVLYNKSNDSIVKGLFQTNDTIYTTQDFVDSGFVFAPFNAEERAIIIPIEQSQLLEINHITPAKQSAHLEHSLKIDSFDAEAKDFHVQMISKAKQAIDNNLFKKVVLSRKEIVKLKEANPITLFQRLLNAYPTAFVYCWYHPKIGLWLGATICS